jgi:thiamine-phosphate pyrophosphorylase
LIDILKQAAQAGARLFQYRDKSSSMRDLYRQALQLRQAAAEAGAVFLINDRCDLALAVDADGVHLGQADLPLKLARRVMGPDKLIGISTHRPAEVREATDGGADYLGFGPIYATNTKPDHEAVVGLEGLRGIRSLTRLPVFAIGGITPDRIVSVLEAGSDGVAIVSAVGAAPDVSAAVRTCLTQVQAARRASGSPDRPPAG